VSVTLRTMRIAEAERDAAGMAAAGALTAESLAFLFRAVMHAYEIRSKWTKRRKGGRNA
jgi:hypothetical protein